MENYRQLFESIFNKNLDDRDARAWLENITKEYPFFTPAHFFLLQQTSKDDEHYKDRLFKTVTLFNNNYWLNYLLTQQEKPTDIEQSFSAQETIADTQTIAVEALLPVEEKITTAVVIDEENTVEAAAEEITTKEEPGVPVEEDAAKVNVTEEANSGLSSEETALEKKPAITLEEPPSAIEEFETAAKEETEEDPELEVDVQHVQELLETAEEETTGIPAEDDDIIQQQNDDLVNDTEPYHAAHRANLNGNDKEHFEAPLKTDLAEAAAILDTKPVEDGPLFEPLHTTDYFASVGIKLSDEIKPGDKLGKQLKSFTEWLKTMKRLQPEQTAVTPESNEKQNSNIQQLAEKSNQDEEIITEAMADVLMQQGRIDKAVEVLKKLSLLNPSKNTYFAAKIDKLKE